MSPHDKNPENEVEEEPFGLGCALEMFKEAPKIKEMIDNLKNIYSKTSISEQEYERFSFIIGQYKEQPHLIDCHLDDILERFIGIVRDQNNSMELKHMTFRYMAVVVNVRGYKVIVRHLPHEVADFEPVLKLLESQDVSDPDTWTTRYVLLLWLSIIVMIPFHLSRFDGFNEAEVDEKTVMNRVLAIIKEYVVVPDKCRDGASYLSARFITRHDVKEKHLLAYFDWAIQQSISPDSNVFVKYGTMASVAAILKHGKREDLLPHAPRLLWWVINEDSRINTGSNVQKLAYKIVQRIGLTFLPPRVASWRYKRGNRSLAENLSGGDVSSVLPSEAELDDDPADHVDVPDDLEEVIDQLIQGLRHADGIVRWSAAKGIGRVTGRLPKELADDVVGSVLELFSVRESDGAWHGGCVALAELGRRGLLLPKRLPAVVPVILKALVYDEPRGYSSVGSHIRDAACYVCWSFARAYERNILEPFVQQIASTLLIVTCFDREINCRRAASAAFQENVGRQGAFPHGIDILTVADFFAVSVRNSAYLNISVYIAQFSEYTIPLIDHLVQRKVDHWDCVIRELAAKALHNLTPQAPNYMVSNVLPSLFVKTNSIDLNSRHGAVLAIGEVIFALAKIAKEAGSNVETSIGADLIDLVKNLVPGYCEKLYFRGLGGELMRQACCDFIEKCSLASLKFKEDAVTENWLDLVNDCIAYNVSNIQLVAINALPVLITEYYGSPNQAVKREELVNTYIHKLLLTSQQETRVGHALALGSLPQFVLQPHLDLIISSLIKSLEITPATQKWAEGRKDSIKALTSIAITMKNEMGKEDSIAQIYNVFLTGLEDYTQDKRGDVGAWVRESSMLGLQSLTFQIAADASHILKQDIIAKTLAGIAQQGVEKIDRTRALGGKIFYSFLYHDVPHIPDHDALREIFPKDECDFLNWNSAAATFPKFVELLKFPAYTYSVMLGMICSIGGLSETLLKSSSSSLSDYLQKQLNTKGIGEINRLCEVVFQIFKSYQKVDRVSEPMLKFLDKFFGEVCVLQVMNDPTSDFAKRMLRLILAEISGSKNIYKLLDSVNVLARYIWIKSDACQSALVQLSIFLCYKQLHVRKTTSTVLYESFLMAGEDHANINPSLNVDNFDEIMQLLCCTNWEEAVTTIKPIRNQLCGLMGIRVPVPKT